MQGGPEEERREGSLVAAECVQSKTRRGACIVLHRDAVRGGAYQTEGRYWASLPWRCIRFALTYGRLARLCMPFDSKYPVR